MVLSDILKKRDLTSGSIPGNLVLTAVPLWIGSLFYLVLPPWELYLVGRLGSEAIAALAIGSAANALFSIAIQGMANSAIAVVGGLTGQNNRQAVNRIAGEILIITLLLSSLLAITGYFVAPALLRLLGARPEVLSIAIPYLRILLVGGIFTSPVLIINGLLRGTGEMRLPMVNICGVIVLNIILLPFFMLGWGSSPQMGLSGTALAYVIAMGSGTAFGLWTLSKRKQAVDISFGKGFRYYLPRLATVREMVNLAGINTLEMFAMNVFNLVMVSFIAGWGTGALAAYGIGQRLLMLFSLAGFDLATSTNIIMANNLGAQKIKRAELSTWWACGLNALIMGVGGLIISGLAGQIASVFNKTPEVVETATNYLRITTPGWFLLAVWLILRRAFVGAKDARAPFLITISCLGVVQLPLAALLPRMTPLGVNGIWLAILAAAVLQGLASAFWFRLGKWKRPFQPR
ncbi:MAG: MATE family efflux transporter [Chloroflexi bacterium]|nr:MATE family efflux transporter [Chloroflexota bacterium]